MTASSLSTNWPEPIAAALKRPAGARFYRCALQINPFAYLKRHSVKTPFPDEDAYNNAIIAACKVNGIEVIGITDHYRIKTSQSLAEAARDAGLHVFPGFEASTKDGVHFLCLFEPSRPLDEIERLIGDCGIHDDDDPSPVGRHDTTELITECHTKWGGVCIAAHVAAKSGLLTTLKGKPAVNAWKHEHLLACSLPGPASAAPDEYRLTLLNKNAEYRRDRPIAVLNCHDVTDPADLAAESASCWVKMATVSCEGLRQAFLDPNSRVRLTSDPMPEDHAEFLALAWEGGFLDGVCLRLSENLNALIGGRGTGKSTIIESIRYVLGAEPFGEQALQQHQEFVKHVLRNGTKISLLVRSHRPASRQYLIERTVPNPPVVRDGSGSVVKLTPADVLPETEVYGQHEISELTRSPEKLTNLLHRFVECDPQLDHKKDAAVLELERTRGTITKLEAEIGRTRDKLETLPALEEKLKRYQELGIEAKLKDRSQLVKEEQNLIEAEGLLDPIRTTADALDEGLPLDAGFLDDEDFAKLPGAETLKKIKPVVAAFNTGAAAALQKIRDGITTAENGIQSVRTEWETRKAAVDKDYQKVLRELQKEKIDGEEFIQLQEQITRLKPLKTSKEELAKQLQEAIDKRRQAVTTWEDLKAEEFRALEKAAKRVTRQLEGRVQVTVTYAGNRDPLRNHLRSLGGRTDKMIEATAGLDSLSLSDLAAKARAGKDSLVQTYPMPAAQAEALASSSTDFLLKLEELHLPATTTIQLNIAADGATPVWRALDELSTGQKATAVLLLLLLESEGPLVVDQPEDDLDNRFITEGIVPAMRREKRRRQFIFATHNANIPVLGDAELIATLAATGGADDGRAEVPDEHIGSIDSPKVQELVEEILEGGKAAFETRRRKYGF